LIGIICGVAFVGLCIAMFAIGIKYSAMKITNTAYFIFGALFAVLAIACFAIFARFTTIYPNEANVYTFFGKYKGTLRKSGMY
jgi:hypothetical protein